MAKQLPYTNPDYVLAATGQQVNMVHCDMATALIDEYMGSSKSTFTGGTITKTYNNRRFQRFEQWLDLSYFPITGVTSIVHIDDSGLETTIDPTTYLLPNQHGEADGYLYRVTGWPYGGIRVTFTYGGNLPEVVRHVATMIANYLSMEMMVSNIKREQIGTYNVEYATDIGMTGKSDTAIQNLLELLPKNFSITAAGAEDEYANIRERLADASGEPFYFGGYV